MNQTVRKKIVSLFEYGVDFYACGNILESLKFSEKDVLACAKAIEVVT